MKKNQVKKNQVKKNLMVIGDAFELGPRWLSTDYFDIQIVYILVP